MRVLLRLPFLSLLGMLLFSSAAWSDVRSEFLETLNADRKQAGLEPVTISPELSKAAEAAIENIVKYGDLPKDAPKSRSMRALIRQAGYPISGFRYPWLASRKTGKGAAWRLLSFETLGLLLMHPESRTIGLAYQAETLRLADGRELRDFWQFVIPHTPPAPYPAPVPDLLKAINKARAEKGAPPLILNAELGKAALSHAQDLVSRRYRGHTSPDGEGPADRVLKTDYRLITVKEILHYGRGTPTGAVDAWDKSPGHAKAMYDPDMVDVGVGYTVGPLRLTDRMYYHVWAAVLAKALPSPPVSSAPAETTGQVDLLVHERSDR